MTNQAIRLTSGQPTTSHRPLTTDHRHYRLPKLSSSALAGLRERVVVRLDVAALGVAAESLDAWRTHLAACGVAVEKELTWPRGGRSVYFRDPAGNSVELVTPGVWGTPAGW